MVMTEIDWKSARRMAHVDGPSAPRIPSAATGTPIDETVAQLEFLEHGTLWPNPSSNSDTRKLTHPDRLTLHR
jgi:hypothetical protein